MQLHHAVKEGFGARRTAGHIDVDGDHLVDSLHHVIAFGERTARNGATADGHHIFGVGHLVVKTQQNGRHFAGDRTVHKNHVGLSRTVARDFETEARHVVTGGSHGHKFDTAAARGKGQRPKAVAASPVDEGVERTDHHADAVLVEFLHQALESFIVLKLFVGDIVDFRTFVHCHSNAPFFQA